MKLLGRSRNTLAPEAKPPAVRPESTTKVFAVTWAAASLARYSKLAAISSGSSALPKGDACAAPSRAAAEPPRTCSISGVTVVPGATALTRMPYCDSSAAAERVSPTTPCLAAV
ncbi:hypothetical protein D9M68_873900 [compost metagenome]